MGNPETPDTVESSGHRLILEGLSEDPTSWKRVDMLKFLNHNKTEYDLDDEGIQHLEQSLKKVSGSTFLNLTREWICQPPYNLEDGRSLSMV